MKPLIVLICLFVCLPCFAFGKLSHIDSLWKQYTIADNGDVRVRLLLQIADGTKDPDKKDSLLNIAIDDARLIINDSLQMDAYAHYFDNTDITFNDQSILYANNMLGIARKYNNNEWLYKAYMALGAVSNSKMLFKEAVANNNQAYYYVTNLDNQERKIECLLALGSSLENDNNKMEAFRKYLNALYISQQINNERLEYNCYQKLSSFYWFINDNRNAIKYKRKQLELLRKHNPVDSSLFMDLNVELVKILIDNKEKDQCRKISKQVLEYAYRHRDERLKKDINRVYRTFLIENCPFKELANYYRNEYPDELRRLSINDTTTFYRVESYICEANGNRDSTIYYYQKTEERILENPSNIIFNSNFFRRYGQFFLRTGNIDSAKVKFGTSFRYAVDGRYFPYVIETSNYLDSINNIQGNYAEAYKYAKLNKVYVDSQANAEKGDELLRLELDNETKQHADVLEKERIATERRHGLQNTGIIVVIAFSFIILAMLGSFKVHRLFIQSLGFFSFILLFEFIVMITDTKIEHLTRGEPWKILAFKLAIIGLISPLHHWLEHKVMHYLNEHKLIDTSKLKWKTMFAKKHKQATKQPLVVKEEVKVEEGVEE